MIAAPRGAVTVEGWSRNEVELVADIEIKGPTEADLDQLAAVNRFVFDEDMNHLSVLTTGTHDRAFMKKAAKMRMARRKLAAGPARTTRKRCHTGLN